MHDFQNFRHSKITTYTVSAFQRKFFTIDYHLNFVKTLENALTSYILACVNIYIIVEGRLISACQTAVSLNGKYGLS